MKHGIAADRFRSSFDQQLPSFHARNPARRGDARFRGGQFLRDLGFPIFTVRKKPRAIGIRMPMGKFGALRSEVCVLLIEESRIDRSRWLSGPGSVPMG
jgi:hypothetical protein